MEVLCVGSTLLPVLWAGGFKSRAPPTPWAEEGSPRMLLPGLLELVSARGHWHLAVLVGFILEPHIVWLVVLGLGTGMSSPRVSLVLISRNPWQPREPSVSC